MRTSDALGLEFVGGLRAPKGCEFHPQPVLLTDAQIVGDGLAAFELALLA